MSFQPNNNTKYTSDNKEIINILGKAKKENIMKYILSLPKERLDCSDEMFARRLGITDRTIRKWRDSKNTTIPSIEYLVAICDELLFDKEIYYLLLNKFYPETYEKILKIENR